LKLWIPFILAFALLFAGCGSNPEKVVIKGKVKIGPFCPVEPCSVDPAKVSEAMNARKVFVYDGTGRKLLYEIALKEDGTYYQEVYPGDYVVDINRIGIDSSLDVPKKITLLAGETAEVNIEIDTGVR
jgi:hypothetical protein